MSLQHFALAVAERAQLFALQQFDVAVQNRERSLEIVRGGGQRVGGALKALAQFLVFLQQVLRAGDVAVGRERRRRWHRASADALAASEAHVFLWAVAMRKTTG